jgi:ABC-type oligopeptide transport system substrate-binding subunit
MNLLKKIIPGLLIVVFSSMIITACSSSKKMKKKCLDCPEFSFSEPVNSDAVSTNETL